MKITLTSAFIALAATFSAPGIAADEHSDHVHMQGQMTAPAQMVDGLVRKVDKTAGKITLTHGPLTNLGMPPMTMAFPVKDPAWLDKIKEGNKIRFMADKVNGSIMIVQIESVK